MFSVETEKYYFSRKRFRLKNVSTETFFGRKQIQAKNFSTETCFGRKHSDRKKMLTKKKNRPKFFVDRFLWDGKFVLSKNMFRRKNCRRKIGWPMFFRRKKKSPKTCSPNKYSPKSFSPIFVLSKIVSTNLFSPINCSRKIVWQKLIRRKKIHRKFSGKNSLGDFFVRRKKFGDLFSPENFWPKTLLAENFAATSS